MTDKQRAALLRSAVADFKKTTQGYRTNPNGPNWRRGLAKTDKLLQDLVFVVPVLGPLVAGGLSTTLHSPTHMSSGVEWPEDHEIYVAFDAGFNQGGKAVLAVEALRVTRDSSAQGGDAFYATGASGIRYWYGHLDVAPPVNATFRRGAVVGRIKYGPGQPPGGPHAHLGLDVTPLGLPTLLYGGQRKPTDVPKPYTYGSPSIGAQLAKGLT